MPGARRRAGAMTPAGPLRGLRPVPWRDPVRSARVRGTPARRLANALGSAHGHRRGDRWACPVAATYESARHGFELIKFGVPLPGTDQQAVWQHIQRLAPNWILLAGPGPMTPAALKGPSSVGFPVSQMIGFGLSGDERDVLQAGDRRRPGPCRHSFVQPRSDHGHQRRRGDPNCAGPVRQPTGQRRASTMGARTPLDRRAAAVTTRCPGTAATPVDFVS